MTRKTLLLLGGSRQQVVAIEEAKALGYRTVLCDYLPDNPGRLVADTFHLVSTTDREAVLGVARDEHVDGVIAYSSDPAAPTAAFVAEALGLPTNPLASVEALSVKSAFRARMAQAGVPCPKAVAVPASATPEEAAALVSDLRLPVMVKPTDSSGSKGVTKVNRISDLSAALARATARGRNGTLVAEEFVENDLPHVVGGDIFVVDGRVRFWGLMACLRDPASPLVPVGKKTPPGLSPAQMRAAKGVLQQMVDAFGVRFGELNVELMFQGGVPYVIELGARAGGNMIPVELSDASGIDLVAANVRCAMGEDPGGLGWEPGAGAPCVATYVLHSSRDGVFSGVELSPEAEAACYRKVVYAEPGDEACALDGADKALGILFFRFADEAEMDAFLGDVRSHVRVLVS